MGADGSPSAFFKMEGLNSSYTANLPAHPAGSIPLDDENKQRVDSAKQSHKQHTKVGEKCTKFLLRLAAEIDDLDREKRLNLFRSQIKAHQYMDGNFDGYVDVNCEWKSATRQEGETWYTDNQLYPYWRTALMELSRTQTEVIINAPSGAEDSLVAAAKFAKARYDANRDRTFNARLKQTENSYALLNGITYRYTFAQFNDASARKEKIPTLKRQEVVDEKVKLCAMCAKPEILDITGQAAEPKCLSCGSDVFIEIGISEQPETVIGYEDLPVCDNAWIVPNPVGVVVSLQASCIEETPFLKWKQMILRSVLQSKFKGMELPSTGTESTELRYITNQQKATPADNRTEGYETTSTETGGRELELLEFQQVWLDYPVYCDVKFEEDTPLAHGKTLQAGKPLGSIYPDGLYFAKCGDLIVDMWNEDKNKKWTSSPYGMRPGSMYGSGSSQALSDQEILNDLETIKMANAWSNGVPREFVDPSIIKELSADPQIPTSVIREPGSEDFGYWAVPANTLSPEIYGMGESRQSSMQNKIGAMSAGSGLADSQKWGDTATAISIKRDLAVGRFSPDLELMADQLDKMQAYQFLENEQKFFTPEQWNKQKGEYGDDALKAFLACDIRRDLVVTIAPGSYMPKSDAQMQAKLIAFANLLPALAQTQNPEIIAYASEVFGIPEHLGGWNSDRAHAGKVVKRFQALAELFIKQYGDLPTNSLDPIDTGDITPDGQPVLVESPTMKAARAIDEWSGMPVDVFLDNHEAMLDAYKDWRTTDEGREASNVLIAAVALRSLKHQEGTAKQAQMAARINLAAEEPLKEAAEAEQMKMLEANNAAAEEERAATEEATQLESMNRLTELNNQDEDRAAEAEKQDKQHRHEKELKAIDVLASQAQATQV